MHLLDNNLQNLNQTARNRATIGCSAAGVYVDNRIKFASLFRAVPRDVFAAQVQDMFLELRRAWNGVPFDVVNDGEVTALAGAMALGENAVLGVALGTSTAGNDALSTPSAWAIGDVDSMVLILTIVRSSRDSSAPTRLARSASVGSPPSSRRSASRAASSSRRTRRTPRGHASRRSASIIAPRTRRSAKVSNLMPRPSSNRCADRDAAQRGSPSSQNPNGRSRLPW